MEDAFPTLSRKPDGPWLAHRLDADTSGCLAIALTKTALVAAQAAFAQGRADKTYWALTATAPAAASGSVDAPLLKRTGKSGWRMVVDPRGAPSVSDYETLASAPGLTLLQIRPRTGRTHQVRVHCASLGCPVLNDPLYGSPAADGGRLALLARALTLPLDPPVTATAPLPDHMRLAIAAHPCLLEMLDKFRHPPNKPQHASFGGPVLSDDNRPSRTDQNRG